MSKYELLSVAKAAEEMGRARWFVYKLIKEKRIGFYRLGGGLAVSRADLDEYVKRARVAPLGERKVRKQTDEVRKRSLMRVEGIPWRHPLLRRLNCFHLSASSPG